MSGTTAQKLAQKLARKLIALLLLCLALLVALPGALPAASQEYARGSGVIVESNLSGAEGIYPLNPLLCAFNACFRVNSLLFPMLLGVDPAAQGFTVGSAANNGLAAAWDVSADGTVYTFTLRADALWSDGTPITAYDVFYSYLAIASTDLRSPYESAVIPTISAVAPLDARTVAVVFDSAGCSSLGNANFPVIPAQVFDPAFVAAATSAFSPGADPAAQFADWQNGAGSSYRAGAFRFMLNHPANFDPPVSGGLFTLDSVRPREGVFLTADAGRRGYAYLDVPDGRSRADLFLNGETNYIENPPYVQRADIRAREGVQVVELPGRVWDYLSFNLAEPRSPQPAFDKDGSPLAQGTHPVLGDLSVRQALSMALDVPALIDAAYQGYAVPLAGTQPPLSWAFNPDLALPVYDPVAAGRLLDAAGWRLVRGAPVRRCVGCQTVREGTALSLTLYYEDRSDFQLVAPLIAEQWARLNVDVRVEPFDPSARSSVVTQQVYDVYLGRTVEAYPVDPDQRWWFSTAADIPGTFLNTGSYSNPRVDALLAQANAPDVCADAAGRAALYREAQALIQQDLPVLPLYTLTNFYAAAPGVQGFAPYPAAPLWNLGAWVIGQ